MGLFVKNYLGKIAKNIVNFKVVGSAPTTATLADFNLGDELVVRGTSNVYKLVSIASGTATWRKIAVEINIDGTLAGADNTTIPSSLATKTYADALAIAGAPNWSESVSGIGQLSTSAEAAAVSNDTTAMTPLKVGQVFAVPPAIGSGTPAAGAFTTISSSSLASLGASATVVTGAVALNLGADAGTGAINVGTGAAVRTITLGNITGATAFAINSGTGHITFTSTGSGDIIFNPGDKFVVDAAGTVDINSSAAVINIANDDVDQDVNIATDGERIFTMGSANGAAGVVINGGTNGVMIGNNAIAQSMTLGNKTGASAMALEVGTGNYTLDGVGASTYTVGASTTSGTITIGGTAQTGTMTIGDSSGINIVQIGSGEGATTVNIAGGATAAKVVNIAIGAVANLVTIGTVSGAASMDLLVGTGNFTLEGDVASTYSISATGANTGTITISGGTGAQTTNIATGGTGVKTVNIGTGAIGNLVTLGTKTAAAALTLQAGTVGMTLDATGLVRVVPVTDSQAAATGTANTNVGVTTHTGLTTASAAAQVFTITNSVCTTGSAILVSASNLGANDAQMTVTRVVPGAGSFTVTLTNNGAAALNGDVILSFWILAA